MLLVGNLLSSYMRDTLHFLFTANDFALSHGKSEVDLVFGLFANVLREYTPFDEIHVADDLRNFFENKCAQFSVGRKHYPRTYIFKVFVFLFLSLLIFLSPLLISLYGNASGRIGSPKQLTTSLALRLKKFKKYFYGDNLIVSKLSSAECQPELSIRCVLD